MAMILSTKTRQFLLPFIIPLLLPVVLLAVCFGFVLGPSSDDYLSVLGMFAIGNLCIILTNMQYISFLFLNNQVL